jgi:hypothetical protein
VTFILIVKWLQILAPLRIILRCHNAAYPGVATTLLRGGKGVLIAGQLVALVRWAGLFLARAAAAPFAEGLLAIDLALAFPGIGQFLMINRGVDVAEAETDVFD